MLPDPDVPPDAVLLARVEALFASMSTFDRAVFAHARLRALAHKPLKPQQRRHLLRLLELLHRFREVQHADEA